MRLQSLILTNWRSYLGRHEIHFSNDPARPVTLIFGANGAGKTALLNAFTWCIYGDFTDGFEKPGQLIHFDALETDATAEVELVFEHAGKAYRIRRTADAASQSGANGRRLGAETSLLVTIDDRDVPIEDVHRVMPPALKDLFFFPAESFSRSSVLDGEVSSAASGMNVGRAISSLLMADVYEHAITDLRTAAQDKSLKVTSAANRDLDKAAEIETTCRTKLHERLQRKEQLPLLIAEAKAAEVAAIQAKGDLDREKFEAHADRLKTLEVAKRDAMLTVERVEKAFNGFARDAFRPLLHRVTVAGLAKLDEAKAAGLMPPDINRQAFEKSLELGRCRLCQIELDEKRRQIVSDLSQRTNDSHVAQRAMKAESLLETLRDSAGKSLDIWRTEVADILRQLGGAPPPDDADAARIATSLRTAAELAAVARDRAKTELDDFTQTPEAEVSAAGNPFQRYENAVNRRHKLEQEAERIVGEVDRLEGELDAATATLSKLAAKDAEAQKKTTAQKTIHEATRYFEALRDSIETGGRADFERVVDETFRSLISKPYRVSVGPDYGLRVHSSESTTDATDVPLSQSEKVLLLLAFLGAIAKLAPQYERVAREKTWFKSVGRTEAEDGQGYPVVLDSPTSPFDTEYEREVISRLPDLLPQLIVPVSAKSADNWEQVKDRVGACYVIELTSADSTDRVVKWDGHDYRYSQPDASAKIARTRVEAITKPA